MTQTFPKLEHIDQILAAINGRTEFTIGRKNGLFILIDYYVMGSDTFKADDLETAQLLRECRGLIFHKDGSVARRAFHKFFNVGETDETSVHKLDLKQQHVILEKLDGSMIAPFITQNNNEIYWASMRGSPEYNENLKHMFDGSQHENLVRAADRNNLTAIFEYCAPDNRIVVAYDEPQMILLGLRDRHSGDYYSYKAVCDFGIQHGVSVVQPYNSQANSISDLVTEIRANTELEGAVIWFENGIFAKLKGDWYLQLHKTLSYFEFEKDIARLILSNNQDDLIGIIDEEKRAKLLTYQTALHAGLRQSVALLEEWRDKIIVQKISRKEFATMDSSLSNVLKSVLFRGFNDWDSADFGPDLITLALNKTNTTTQWEQFKQNARIELSWGD